MAKKQQKDKTESKEKKLDQFLVLNYSLNLVGYKPAVEEEHAAGFSEFNAEAAKRLAEKPGLHAYVASVVNRDLRALVVYQVKDQKDIGALLVHAFKTFTKVKKEHPIQKNSVNYKEAVICLTSMGLVDRKTYEKDISDKVNSITLK
ncbi:hypothetical protein KY331_01720 [Candidatus Woesearchaeota archaeon]|nr:hypothetical protein [Candidatus Woesearchaeota archaeon]